MSIIEQFHERFRHEARKRRPRRNPDGSINTAETGFERLARKDAARDLRALEEAASGRGLGNTPEEKMQNALLLSKSLSLKEKEDLRIALQREQSEMSKAKTRELREFQRARSERMSQREAARQAEIKKRRSMSDE